MPTTSCAGSRASSTSCGSGRLPADVVTPPPVDGVELPLQRLDAVIFDMDGVITDTAATHGAAWKQILDEVLESVDRSQLAFDDDDYRQYVDGRHRDDGVERFLSARGLTLPRGAVD